MFSKILIEQWSWPSLYVDIDIKQTIDQLFDSVHILKVANDMEKLA